MSQKVDSSDEYVPKKLVIVGGGIGGLSSAFDARHILNPKDEITVISANEQFQFTPSNPWVGTRKRTPEDISLPLAKILPRHKIVFIHDEAVKLDPQNQHLELQGGFKLEYDYLIIATGPRLAFEEIPGAGPKKDSQSICTTPHASATADLLDKVTADPGPLVIGATQGASCFGPAYEFALSVQHELKQRGGKALLDQCKITMVTSEPYLGHLGLGGAGKSQEILENLLKKRDIDYITNCRVIRVDPDSVAVEYYLEDGKTRKKEIIPSKLTMLIPAFRGARVWSAVPGLTDKSGLILTNEQMQSVKYPNIFGVGIAVSLPPLEKTLVPTGAPKTGYMIESMGTAAVKNIKYLIDHGTEQDEVEDLPHIPLLNGLCITDFGDDGAIFLTLPQMQPRRQDVTIDGKIATLAKIAFEKYFLHKIESGDTDPYYEKYMLHLIGVDRTKMKKPIESSS